MEMETQQPLKLQVIFTRTMVAALIANWLQTKVPPRMISKRYVTVSVRGSLGECFVLSNLKHFAPCALLQLLRVWATVIPRWKMQTGDTLTRGNQQPVTTQGMVVELSTGLREILQ